MDETHHSGLLYLIIWYMLYAVYARLKKTCIFLLAVNATENTTAIMTTEVPEMTTAMDTTMSPNATQNISEPVVEPPANIR